MANVYSAAILDRKKGKSQVVKSGEDEYEEYVDEEEAGLLPPTPRRLTPLLRLASAVPPPLLAMIEPDLAIIISVTGVVGFLIMWLIPSTVQIVSIVRLHMREGWKKWLWPADTVYGLGPASSIVVPVVLLLASPVFLLALLLSIGSTVFDSVRGWL